MIDCANILNEIERQDLLEIIATINHIGFITDEDGTYATSTLIENWSDKCSEILIQNGLSDSDLTKYAEFISDAGAIYILYDNNRMTLEEIQSILIKKFITLES